MSNRVIPITLQANTSYVQLSPRGASLDTLQRPLRDLRISVTDRCNFRCVYCMPRAVFDRHYSYLPSNALLTFEEITRLAKLLVAHGVTKIRITGGEPLLRKNLEKLVSMLRELTTPNGIPLELALTTNGALLAQKAQQLKEAGLDRVTISLDALDDRIFKRMNDANFSVTQVLHGVDVAHQVGLGPIKINMVVKARVNESQILPMARHFKNSPFTLRFIEYMDVGSSNNWAMHEVVPSPTVLNLIHREMPLVPVSSNYPGETAQRWKYKDGIGEIGVISSVTKAFCTDCTRLRLSTEGKLYTCLFASQGHDVRQLLRSQVDDARLSIALGSLWQTRADRYSEMRSKSTLTQQKIEMSYIGG